MIKVSVMYPNEPGVQFDMDYYVEKHLPMVRDRLGAACLGMEAEEGVAGGEPGSSAPYVAIAHLRFESLETFASAFGPHAEAIEGDVPNYSSVRPTIQIGRVCPS